MVNESSYESEENDESDKVSIIDSLEDQHQEALNTLAIQLNNLPPDVSEEEICETFQEYGTIAEPGIIIRHYSGNAAAFVNFNSPSVVQNILKSRSTFIIRGFNLTIKAGDLKFFNLHKAMDNDDHVMAASGPKESNRKSMVPKHYAKPSRSHAKSNFESYPVDTSNRWRKQSDESDSETSDNIVHCNTVEDDCLVQPKNMRELKSNFGGSTQRSKNSKRLPEQTENGSLNHVRNEETRKKKEDEQQCKQLIPSERPKQMHSTTIQIRNISLLSEEILRQYFKNERRSHGGKVAKIVFEKAYDRAIVDFDNADVAEKVLNKNDHLLEGQRLYVSRLPPQSENRYYFENIPKWVTLSSLKIYLEGISQSLIEDVRFVKDNEDAIISFRNEVFDLQNKLNKRPFKDDNGRQINGVKIHPIVHPDAVLICGKFPNIDRLIYPIEDFLSNFQDKVNPNIRTVFAKEESNMTLVIFEDYRAVSFLKGSLTIGDNTFSISPFFDHLGWVSQDRKTNVLRECPFSIITSKLSPLQIEFLSKPVGINFVHAEVDKQQWHCDFEVTEEKVLAVITEKKGMSEQITKYILGCMTSVDIILDDAMMKFWSEKESELQYLVSDKDIRKWFCYSQNKSLLTILAASSEIEEIKKDIERFFSDNAMYEATIVENEMHGKYLKKFHKSDLMLKCFTKFNGIIPFKFNCNGAMIASGTKHQIQMLKVDISELLSHVQIFQYVIKTPGMASHFQSQAGLTEISMIAYMSQTIIDIDYDNKSATNNVAQFSDGVKLEGFLNQKLNFVVVHGDITVQNVDCIVNDTNANLYHVGGIAAAIVQAGGQQIQQECSDFVNSNGLLDVSDVFVSNAGNLPCKKVIHVVGPRWKGGIVNEETKLHNAVVSCIKAAKSENFSSIAFPAVSIKNFGYPPEKAVPVIIDAIIKTTGDVGPLYEIKLVDTDENTTKLFSETIASLNGFQDKNQSAISKLVLASAFDSAVQSTISLYKTLVGKSSAVQERTIEQSVTLCICGPSQNVQHARKMLNNACDEKRPELIVSRDIICAFDPVTIAKLHQQAVTFSVEIEIIREQCKIKVKGYRAFDFQNFLTDVLDKMKDELTGVIAKWYKRKDTSSSWEEIKIGVSRLEKKYQRSGGQGCIQFESENDGLVSIDFNNMVFLSAAKNILYDLKRLGRFDIPSEWDWDWDGKCLIDYKLVKLKNNTPEYSTVATVSRTSSSAYAIIEKIERVENPCKYQQYTALKRKIEQSLSGVSGCVAEQYLFCNTAAENIPGICTHGFNHTLHGQKGLYGHGLYFQRLMHYGSSTHELKAALCARVLTGNCTEGKSNLSQTPSIYHTNGLRFDSVVDNAQQPSVYMVFSDNHAYPAYVVTYKP